MNNSEATILSVEGIGKQFPRTQIPALSQIRLQLKQGEILGLLGPSGCGKTTLLRTIAGFEKADEGKITIGETVVTEGEFIVPPEKRGVGMVFQDYALFPHLKVDQNIAFGLENIPGYSKKAIRERVKEVLYLVGLERLGHRYPHQLSGGQQQRVALARALAPRPALVLLDEPLSNLDVQVRLRLRQELRRILKAAGISAIFVTHDREEALSMSDWVAVMQNGKIEQFDRPEEIYLKPSSRFVAEFVTQANFLPCYRQGEFWETELGKLPAHIENKTEENKTEENNPQEKGELMIPQEHLILNEDQVGNGRVYDREFLGREHRYNIEMDSKRELIARCSTAKPIGIGSRVKVSLTPHTPIIFPHIKQ